MANIAEQVGEMENIDWFDFVGDDGIAYSLQLNFLFSTWTCTYGQGCPGIIYDRDTSYEPTAGCCTGGAYIDSEDDYKHVEKWFKKLTKKDMDPERLAELRKNGWANVRNTDPDRYNVKTRVKEGRCVFSLRGTEAEGGRIGCAFLHLATRLKDTGIEDVDHSDVMPKVCWQLPFKQEQSFDDDGELAAVTIFPWHVADWFESGEDEEVMEWWCVDNSTNYVFGGEPLFRTAKNELAKLIGGMNNYNRILPELNARYDAQYVAQMRPARPDGRNLIPLAIKGRTNAEAK